MLNDAAASVGDFDGFARSYAQRYLAPEARQEFLDWFSRDNLRELLAHEERASFHYESLENVDGHRYFAVQAVRVPSDEGCSHVLVGFRYIDDVVEKERAAQEKLQKALDEARLNNEIISAISKNCSSIYRIDVRNDRYEEISSKGETHQLTGIRGCASQRLMDACDTLIAPEYRDTLREFFDVSTLAERLRTEEFLVTEYRMLDGNWHRFSFIAKKRDAAGDVTHVLVTIRSISDAKRREIGLQYEAEAARREAETKSRFLATMSHDIRTPLNGVIGMVNLADQHPDDPEIQRMARAKSLESLSYLVSLVNDVLDMNKLQSGKLKDRELTFDVIEVLQRLNLIYMKKCNEKGLKYEAVALGGGIIHPVLVGNSVYLGRVLSNIADNAIKFSEAGSEIRVAAGEELMDDGRVLFSFTCADEGVGMSPEFLERAFDMFAQEKETSRSTYQGTGLGLAIVKQLVDRMGGTIELRSEPGAGTTATVKLPFKVGEQSDVSVVGAPDGVSVKGIRALVVEDNELNTEIVRVGCLHRHAPSIEKQAAVALGLRRPAFFGLWRFLAEAVGVGLLHTVGEHEVDAVNDGGRDRGAVVADAAEERLAQKDADDGGDEADDRPDPDGPDLRGVVGAADAERGGDDLDDAHGDHDDAVDDEVAALVAHDAAGGEAHEADDDGRDAADEKDDGQDLQYLAVVAHVSSLLCRCTYKQVLLYVATMAAVVALQLYF